MQLQTKLERQLKSMNISIETSIQFASTLIYEELLSKMNNLWVGIIIILSLIFAVQRYIGSWCTYFPVKYESQMEYSIFLCR